MDKYTVHSCTTFCYSPQCIITLHYTYLYSEWLHCTLTIYTVISHTTMCFCTALHNTEIASLLHCCTSSLLLRSKLVIWPGFRGSDSQRLDKIYSATQIDYIFYHYNGLKVSAVQCSAVQRSVMQGNAVQCSTVHCGNIF